MPGATVSEPVAGVDAARAACQAREQKLTALIGRFAKGDQEAFAALYDASSALVYSLALRILRDRDVATEITMEVYTQVYQQISHYDQYRGTPSAWLITLTRCRAIDRWRKESSRQQGESSIDAGLWASAIPEPETYSSTIEIQRAVRTALAALCPEQRQVIEIAYYEGLSHRQIAARLGQPLGTVKARLRTGMKVLRNLLAPLLTEEQAPASAPSKKECNRRP